MTRREFLRAAATAGTAATTSGLSGCFPPRPERRVLRSKHALPAPFQSAFRRLPVCSPHVGADGIARMVLATRQAEHEILPGVSTTIHGYEGQFPGPILEVERGQRTLFLLRNQLSFPIVNHLHGGRTEPHSDGSPMDFIEPASSMDTVPDLASAASGGRGRGWQIFDYANQQPSSMLWYHDHRMDHTGQQVWNGLAGVYLIRDAEERALQLPKGKRELVLVLTDRSFDSNGQLHYPTGSDGELDPAYMGGVIGDVLLVNGVPWPKLEVETARYRLRILNASNAREYTLHWDKALPSGASFSQIGSDGGLLEKAVARRSVELAPAERVDMLVDFSGCEVGKPIRLLNSNDAGSMGLVMQVTPVKKVVEAALKLPERLTEASAPDRAAGMMERTFDFKYSRRKGVWTINGLEYDHDRIDARPKLNSTEIWHLRSDFTHPVHLHLVHFRVLQHAGTPDAGDMGWKDTVRLVAGQTSTILIPFTGYTGRYVFHCHNLEHEDMRMMANFEVVA